MSFIPAWVYLFIPKAFINSKMYIAKSIQPRYFGKFLLAGKIPFTEKSNMFTIHKPNNILILINIVSQQPNWSILYRRKLWGECINRAFIKVMNGNVTVLVPRVPENILFIIQNPTFQDYVTSYLVKRFTWNHFY